APAQRLDVTQEVLCGVRAQVGRGISGMRTAPPTVALIEQDDAVGARVEQPSEPRRASRAWAAVENEGGLTGRGAAALPVDEIAVTGAQHAVVVRLDFGIEVGHP